jgi:Cu-Zn family superoxide dismutase
MATFSGLKPGLHGFHIHEYGDITDESGKLAGSHFNPNKQAHGGPEDQNRHGGDLGNISADVSGNASVDIVIHGVSLIGAMSILGRSVVIHENPDDLKTQPAGNAGSRIGVGVIGLRP